MASAEASVLLQSAGSSGEEVVTATASQALSTKRIQVVENQLYPGQIKVFDSYQSGITQGIVAFIIILNFLIQCVKHEIDAGCAWEYLPNADDDLICKHESIWDFWKWFFNIVFLLELIWNLAGSLCKPFFADAWNWFDCLVVGLGVLDMLQLAPPRLKLLRMVRAFRIFRLFGRVESLRKILMSLVKSFAGLGNAGVIVLIVMCIYAVLAVDLFGEAMCAKDGAPLEGWEETNHHGDMCYGIGYFGSFVTSLYTMFQILTGESWSEGVVWPMLDYYGGKEGTPPNHFARYCVMAFFTSFVIITQFILLNVVVTVLIDGMNQAVDEPTQKDTQEYSQLEGRQAILELLQKTQDDLDNMKKMVEAMPTSP